MDGISIDTAVEEAAHYHAGQTDKQGQPYILHPLRVMLAVSERARVVAVLHDTLEDTEINPAWLATQLLPDDIKALDLVTRRADETYDGFIKRITFAPGLAGTIAREVKIADIEDNLERLTPELERLRSRYVRAHALLQATALVVGWGC